MHLGVGGGGGNAVNTMIRSGVEGVDFIVANTDSQALKASLAPHKIQLGKELTKGLGAGADPDIGRDAALEDRHEIQELLSDADMVFITAGMGGGTGTGAAAVVAQISRELGALTVAVVTKPFTFEGKRRRKHAEMGISRLREAVDTLITIPNQRLLQIATPDLSMLDAFKMADNVLVNAVRGISDIINTPGLINVDFADVKTVMSSMGHALMGIGHGIGGDRALTAAKQAISSPLLEDIDIEGATGILINITAGTNVSIMEVNNACMVIQEAAHEDANIIFGAVIDESLGEEIRITVIATGFPVDDSTFVEEHTGLGLPQVRSVSHHLTTGAHSSSQRLGSPSLASQAARPFNASRPLTQPSSSNPRNTLPQVPVAGHRYGGATQPSQDHQTASNTAATPSWNRGSSSRSEPQEAPQASQASPTSYLQAPPEGDRKQASKASVMDVFQEAKDLADWSLGESEQDQSEVSSSAALATFKSPGAQVFPEDILGLGSENRAGLPIVEVSRSTADAVFDQDQPLEGLLAAQTRSGAAVGASASTSDSIWGFDDSKVESVTFEIDRKIDEALALAGRFSSPGNAAQSSSLGDLDDLDLPAFLRHGASESPKA